jgi:hypothetical protein
MYGLRCLVKLMHNPLAELIKSYLVRHLGNQHKFIAAYASRHVAVSRIVHQHITDKVYGNDAAAAPYKRARRLTVFCHFCRSTVCTI